MATEQREGKFVNVLTLEDLQPHEESPLDPKDMELMTEDSEFLDPVEVDEGLISELKAQDLDTEVEKLVIQRLMPDQGPLGPSSTLSRSYRALPNIDEYAVDKSEIERLGAKQHELSAEVIDSFPAALWHYEKCDATCVFCYEQLMGPCHKCLCGESNAAQCKIALGQCGHPIHADCQASWSGNTLCMTCQQAWKVKTELPVYGYDLVI